MIGRRKSPDGMPFRLYERLGKFKVSYGYKHAGQHLGLPCNGGR